MSVQNLFQENDYSIYAKTLLVQDFESEKLTVVNSADSNKKVDITVNNNSTLVIGDNGNADVFCDSIQFSGTNSNILDYYKEFNNATSSTPITVLDINSNNVTLTNINNFKITRVGNIVTIICPSFSTLISNGLSSNPYISSPIPSDFRSPNTISTTVPYLSTNTGLNIGLVILNTTGVLEWHPAYLANGVNGYWDPNYVSGNTSINVLKTTFSFIV